MVKLSFVPKTWPKPEDCPRPTEEQRLRHPETIAVVEKMILDGKLFLYRNHKDRLREKWFGCDNGRLASSFTDEIEAAAWRATLEEQGGTDFKMEAVSGRTS